MFSGSQQHSFAGFFGFVVFRYIHLIFFDGVKYVIMPTYA